MGIIPRVDAPADEDVDVTDVSAGRGKGSAANLVPPTPIDL